MDAALLKQIPLFSGLTSAQLQKVSAIAQERSFSKSQSIFKEDEPGSAMYIIGQGKVRISKQVPGVGEEALAILEVGAYFGEMALIEEGPRSAEAIAHPSCVVWAIEREALDQVMFTDKDLAYALLWTFVRTLAGRLRETNDKIKVFFALSRF